MRERLEHLQRVYDRVPSFQCKEGCSECCGPIRWSNIEDENIRHYLADHNMEYRTKRLTVEDVLNAVVGNDESGVTCPYVENDRCFIYPARPLLCRLYGACEELPCPHAHCENPLTKDQVQELFRKVVGE